MLVVLDSLNLAKAEEKLCKEALDAAGSIVEAANLLGITRHALKRRIIKHDIKWPPAAHRGPAQQMDGMSGHAGPGMANVGGMRPPMGNPPMHDSLGGNAISSMSSTPMPGDLHAAGPHANSLGQLPTPANMNPPMSGGADAGHMSYPAYPGAEPTSPYSAPSHVHSGTPNNMGLSANANHPGMHNRAMSGGAQSNTVNSSYHNLPESNRNVAPNFPRHASGPHHQQQQPNMANPGTGAGHEHPTNAHQTLIESGLPDPSGHAPRAVLSETAYNEGRGRGPASESMAHPADAHVF